MQNRKLGVVMLPVALVFLAMGVTGAANTTVYVVLAVVLADQIRRGDPALRPGGGPSNGT